MSSWVTVELGAAAWSAPVAPPVRPPWPEQARLVRLGDLASVRSLAPDSHAPKPLVQPSDVGPDGRLRPRRTSTDGAVVGDALAQGDVLVPVRGERPCVLVSEETRHLAFRGFLVVRAAILEDAGWIWAVLSSTSGEGARRQASSSSRLATLGAATLSELTIPALVRTSRRPTDYLPRPLVEEAAGVETPSVWEARELRNASTWTTRPAFEAGVPLSTLAKVWSGNVGRDESFSVEAPERVRVLTSRHVRGIPDETPRWAKASRTTGASTLVITRNRPHRTVIPGGGFALEKGLLALDVFVDGDVNRGSPGSNERVTALARFLGSPEGEALVAAHGVGRAAPQLSASVLSRIALPERALSTAAQDDGPLAKKLEAFVRGASEP